LIDDERFKWLKEGLELLNTRLVKIEEENKALKSKVDYLEKWYKANARDISAAIGATRKYK
jgi:hypothetical protein